MKFLRAIIFFSFFLNFTNSKAVEKSEIINKLRNIDNIQFSFNQKTNKNTERGECILVFPNKLKCNYEDKNKKELIVNKKMMAITQKRYGKTLFYPLSKTTFINILSKDELIKIISESDTVIDNYLNVIYIKEDNTKILIKFHKETFLLAGWETLDQYNNQIIFDIQINSINQIVDDEIFNLPTKS